MKILYSNKSLYPFEGGGDVSAFTLLEHLAENKKSFNFSGKRTADKMMKEREKK